MQQNQISPTCWPNRQPKHNVHYHIQDPEHATKWTNNHGRGIRIVWWIRKLKLMGYSKLNCSQYFNINNRENWWFSTSFISISLGQKYRLTKSNLDLAWGTRPVMITPCPGHFRISSMLGWKSITSFSEGRTTCKILLH